jgi:hypothetical protein
MAEYIMSRNNNEKCLCNQSHKEWERLKRFGNDGGWELLANAYKQEQIWKDWEKRNCNNKK